MKHCIASRVLRAMVCIGCMWVITSCAHNKNCNFVDRNSAVTFFERVLSCDSGGNAAIEQCLVELDEQVSNSGGRALSYVVLRRDVMLKALMQSQEILQTHHHAIASDGELRDLNTILNDLLDQVRASRPPEEAGGVPVAVGLPFPGQAQEFPLSENIVVSGSLQVEGETRLSGPVNAPINLINLNKKEAGDPTTWQPLQALSRDVYIGSYRETPSTFDESVYTYGGTWKQNTSAPAVAAWYAVAMSADGRFQTAVGDSVFYSSSDYGNTWVANSGVTQTLFWDTVAMSADGKYQTAADGDGFIYTSSNFGQSWTAVTSAPSGGWQTIAMSADGSLQEALQFPGSIYISRDHGVTWTANTSAPSGQEWLSIAMSSDGKYQTAIVFHGGMYRSEDYGKTWAVNTEAPVVPSWFAIAMSSDGKYQTATASIPVHIGPMYISSDYGVHWNQSSAPVYWQDVDMSADGKYQTAVKDGIPYLSTDYGNTWVASSLPSTTWWTVAISADGKYQTALVNNGAIYTSRTDVTLLEEGLTLSGTTNINEGTSSDTTNVGNTSATTNIDGTNLFFRNLPDDGVGILGDKYITVDTANNNKLYMATGIASSRRYKENISDLGDVEEQVRQLRPVNFNYIADTSKRSMPGLIAEEVEHVMPELVVYNKKGQVESVKYQNLTAVLLKQIQKQQNYMDEQKRTMAAFEARLALLEKRK